MFKSQLQNRNVLVTGHTGFKGSWLCQWLIALGARVHGIALDPQPHETLFDSLQLGSQLASDHRCDIDRLDEVTKVVKELQPEVVLHLAAQPLVRKSFECPVETFRTNVMGSIHVMEAVRTAIDGSCVVLAVTTDKCYENKEWLYAYREVDAMGGYDPYSASKGCAELTISAYRNSFFQNSNIKLASARAGNVIGGGDWAIDRIVPDIFRSLFANQPILVRNQHSTRPWQHVLEPLSGYLWLVASLLLEGSNTSARDAQLHLATPFNFGPNLMSNRTVVELVKEFLKHTSGEWIDGSDPHAPHEASKLNLAIDKAYHLLGWYPTWDFATTIEKTFQWYSAVKQGADARSQTLQQIEEFHSTAQAARCPWAS